MPYTGGAVTDLRVVRTGQRTIRIEFTVPDDGAGAGAQVQVRAATIEVGHWWWGNAPELFTTGPGEHAAGAYVIQAADVGFDLDGRSLHVRAVAFRFDEAEGRNVFSAILPPEPGMLKTFGVWSGQEPEPEPEPVVQQQFVVVTPEAGEAGVTLMFDWAGPLDSVTFFIDGLMSVVAAAEAGSSAQKFFPLGRTLVEGEVLEVSSVARFEDRDSAPFPPGGPFQITVAPAPVAEPDPSPEPEPGPEPSVTFPAVGTAEFPANLDEFHLIRPDGQRLQFGRLWKWLSFGWFGTWGVYLGREE